jgi:squalene-hopene/tetraprenyl-beta-curcumene cyclase
VNTNLRKSLWPVLAGAVWALSAAGPVRAAEGGGVDPKEVKAVVTKAVAFLGRRQAADGSFSGKAQGLGPGISALVVAALLRNGVSADDPLVARTLAYLEGKVQKDGGIYDRVLANYVTSVALMAFAEANSGGKYDTLLRKGTAFLKRLQYDGSRTDDKDVKFGGVGYDAKSKHPDLSNTYQFLEAMQAAGVPKDDPAVQRALKFISRCQNLPGETNDQPFARKTTEDDKGGLTYFPLDVDDNPHKTPNGGLRSLGGMTYAGLKSFLYAGVGQDDPRVKAAVNWIRRHYSLEENPGMGQAGLYYYYHTFAKAMNAWGEEPFVDAAGRKHDWRRELFEVLKKNQRADGSWVNVKDRQFAESNPDLATAFALLALSYCEAPKK